MAFSFYGLTLAGSENQQTYSVQLMNKTGTCISVALPKDRCDQLPLNQIAELAIAKARQEML